jgi:acyl-CoA thioesterase FadM
VTRRSSEEWRALLGDAKAGVVSRLPLQDGQDLAATRVWAAAEAAQKALGRVDIAFSVERSSDRAVLFGAHTESGNCSVLTLPVRPTLGAERVLALVVRSQSNAVATPVAMPSQPITEHITIEDGPDGERVFVVRFPLAFKDFANSSGGLRFSAVFAWMGRVREIALGPVLGRIASDCAGGAYGLVTNYSQSCSFEEVSMSDEIEARFAISDRLGPLRSSLDLGYEWYRVNPNGRRQIGASRQRTTWVKIVGHAAVEPAPLPGYLDEFVDARRKRTRREAPPGGEIPAELSLGAALSAGHSASHVPLRSEVFSTTSEDANFVGNVYFANYTSWQARLRDALLYEITPDVLIASHGAARYFCTEARVDHLRDVMPFEHVEVRMSLGALYERGAELVFDYYRIAPDGFRQKAAVGKHTLVLARRVEGTLRAEPLPAKLREFLLGPPSSSREARA